jgi:uncharacterized protein YkwD
VLSFHVAHCPRHHSGASHADPPVSAGDTHPPVLPEANGSCAGATLAPSPQNVEQVRTAVMCLVNRERIDRDEPALGWNESLTHAAQGHSETMVAEGYFAHVGPGGDTPVRRMRQAGYIYSEQLGYEIGENIGWGTLSLGTPSAMVASWMASPGHRANILDARFRDTGVGVSPQVPAGLSEGQPGGMYTQDFGVIIA